MLTMLKIELKKKWWREEWKKDTGVRNWERKWEKSAKAAEKNRGKRNTDIYFMNTPAADCFWQPLNLVASTYRPPPSHGTFAHRSTRVNARESAYHLHDDYEILSATRTIHPSTCLCRTNKPRPLPARHWISNQENNRLWKSEWERWTREREGWQKRDRIKKRKNEDGKLRLFST